MSDDDRGLRFGTVAEQYDRFRPEPPARAASLLGDLSGRAVLELGAGTGKLTGFLLARGARVSVVEPDVDMVRVLRRRCPAARVVSGRAESVEANEGEFELVISSSAWHWFAQPDATNEAARVLRDDGALHVWWNGFSRDVAWMEELTALRERAGDVRVRPRGWHLSFDADGPFADAENFALDWSWPRTVDEVVGHFATFSGAIVRENAERLALEVEVRNRLRERAIDGVVAVPMTLRGTSARRRAR